MAGVQVQECPIQFLTLAERNKNSHAITHDELQIPLKLRGVISYFSTRMPTKEEMDDTITYTHIELTSSNEWEPYNDNIMNDEEKMLSECEDPTTDHRIISTMTSELDSTRLYQTSNRFLLSIQSTVIVQVSDICSAQTKRKGTVTASELSKKWYIGLQAANRTIQQTTQRGVRDFLSTGGYKRMKHTAHQLLYRHIRSAIYTDTMFSKVKSLRQMTCAQIYVTSFHFTKAYPMKSKSDAHVTLDSLHHDVGVFHTIIPDNAKELTEGEFWKKALHAGSQIRPIEAHRHNQNLAESGIRELRRMYRKAMRTTNAPYVLWDSCLYLMAEIRSHTVLDIPELDGDTPYVYANHW
jgi:hypothetical protein